MTTLLKSKKNKPFQKANETYSTLKEASLAKNASLIKRIKELNLKVVVNK